jgi:hypothetical protein
MEVKSKLEQVVEYLLAHPHDSTKQISKSLGVSITQVHRAKRELVASGERPAPRNAKGPAVVEPIAVGTRCLGCGEPTEGTKWCDPPCDWYGCG